MASVAMVDMSNKKVKDVELPAVFGVEVKSHLLHSAVVNQLANRRAGTAATKTKGLVSGGGKKPFKQKGTGTRPCGKHPVSAVAAWRNGIRTAAEGLLLQHAEEGKACRPGSCALVESGREPHDPSGQAGACRAQDEADVGAAQDPWRG